MRGGVLGFGSSLHNNLSVDTAGADRYPKCMRNSTAPTPPRFPFSRAKLARGRRHIEELAAILEDHLARKPVLAIQYDRYEGTQYQSTMKLFTREILKADAVMVFGDAVHNLRAALDHLINEIVAERRTPPTDLAFPFAKNAELLGKQIREKMKDTTTTERDLVRSLKPFRDGNKLLFALHELDLRDKHRSPIDISVLVLSHSMQFDGYKASGAPNMVHHCTFSPIPPEVEALLTPVPHATCLGVINEATLSAEIADTLPLAKTPVIETLRNLAMTVESVIDQFADLKPAD